MRIAKAAARARRVPATATILALIPTLLLGAANGAAHQESGSPQEQSIRRVVRDVEIVPRIGPPGTMVTLRSSPLPALTPMQLAFGGTRSGFEEIAFAQTDDEGRFEETAAVPEWPERDQTHRFIIFDLYFSSVLAESGIFHVTDPEGKVVREGSIGSAGADCRTLEGTDGERYRLIEAAEELEPGERVRLEGFLSESEEDCGEGVSLDLRVVSIQDGVAGDG